MPDFGELPKSSVAAWLGLVATVVGLTVFVRGPFVDAYNARWPLAILTAALLGLLVWSVIRQKRAVQVIQGRTRIQSELAEIVANARESLVCAGSRSRDYDYLQEIEDRVRSQPSLQHLRIFCGDLRHAVLKQHAKNLMALRTGDPAVAGRIRMAMCPAEIEPEPSICVSESRAFVVVPALGTFGRYDSAIVLRRPADVKAVRAYVNAMFSSGRELTSVDDVDALVVVKE